MENDTKDHATIHLERVDSPTGRVSKDATSTTDQLLNSGCFSPLSIGQFKSESRTLEECRRSFKEEVVRLKKEVETFRADCDIMIEQDRIRVEEHRQSCDRDLNRLLQEYEHKRQAITEKNECPTSVSHSEFLERKQSCLDDEQDLFEREESLFKEQRRLQDYDQELEDIERNLNRREKMCDAQNKNLIALQEELNHLRQELETSKTSLPNADVIVQNRSSNNTKYSDIIDRDQKDRYQSMESTVSRYRSELANAEAKLTIKDIALDKLQAQIETQQEEVTSKNMRINQLESRLVLALSEHKPEPINKKMLCRRLSTTSTTSNTGVRNPEKPLKRRHTVNNLLSGIRGRKKPVESMDSVEDTENDGETYTGPMTSSTFSSNDTPSTLHDYNSLNKSEIVGGTSVCAIM